VRTPLLWAIGYWLFPPCLGLFAAQPALAAATNSSEVNAIPPLRPPHPELPPSFWERYGLWVILLGVLLLVLVGVVVWLVTRSRPPLLVPPYEVARRELAPLRQKPKDGALLSQVSQILRHYIVAAFNLPPAEMTTTEFCAAIASNAQIGRELAAALSDFFRLCDHDKFSPPVPVPPLNAVAQALKLIDQAQARLAALAQPASEGIPRPNAVSSSNSVKSR
jgi:Domain of unknown function (DUF4381)